MAMYEYRCAACGFQQEYLQKMSDAPLTDCPECGQPSFSKMVTAAGFQLKGSGWYATDFKHGAKPKSKPDDKPAPQADAKPAPETKAAAEAPAKKSEAAASTATSGASPGSR
jgi:putative FmdB family regulatory protein